MHKELSLQTAFGQVAQQQQTLISAIFPSVDNKTNEDFDPRGLTIYRHNLLATAKQALTISYPTILTLIGEDLFTYACRELLVTSPPKHGDWALWGEGFSTLLSGLAQLSDYPFVADIAQLDWLRQQSMRAKDSIMAQPSLQLLATHDIDELYIELTSSQFQMSSSYPVIEFWLAHQQSITKDTTGGRDQAPLNQVDIAKSVDKLAQGDFSQKILIYRPYFNAEIRELSVSEYHWLTLLNKGISIGKALDMIGNDDRLKDDFDFAVWIGQALKENLISCLKT